MSGRGGHIVVALALGTGLSGCAQATAPADAEQPTLTYLGSAAKVLDDDLINIFVSLDGAHLKGIAAREAAGRYADCAVAGHSLQRGYGFARHIRTNVTEDSGVWRADAVYTISRTLPRGIRTIDARAQVATCAAEGIPTV
ncbi:hypothetical protein [Actibacterium ureilyticum]|uniref:hypothetical protein n=1 Tax=Actibacterium ureilyticum TaxID=1590614 RepID=UPI001FE3482E|nr:hypothetical protein [Actibacterium ureilyticum]